MQAKLRACLLITQWLVAVPSPGGATPFPEALLKGERGESVKEVVEDPTVHREMSGLRLSGEQAVFEHLLGQPDFAASLARAAGVLKYTVERRGEAEYWVNDHKGITGRLAILQAEPGRMVLYAKGTYKKGIFRIPGRLALVMRFSEGADGNGPYVENALSGYVRLDAALLDPIARLFRPLVARIMEKRVHWFFRKVNRLMTRLYQDPEAVLQKLPPNSWHEEADRLRVLLARSRNDLGRPPQTENLLGQRDSFPHEVGRNGFYGSEGERIPPGNPCQSGTFAQRHPSERWTTPF